MADEVSAIVELADALDRVNDLVSGVIGLAGGHLGGGSSHRSWLGRRAAVVASGLGLGAGSVAARLAATHGPEQLRKAAIEAERAAAALEVVRADSGWASLAERLDRIDVTGLPARLRVADPRSTELRSLHLELQGASGAVLEARTRRVLDERRRREGS